MPKVLICSEFSQLGSGYAVYTKELVEGLHRRGIEVAELASYCKPDDPRLQHCPWKVYPVVPHHQDQKGMDTYRSHPNNAFGGHIFESVLLDYKPDVVIDIRDIWNLVFETTSPLRDYYAYLVMPAIDSDPQLKTWLELYRQADGVLTYCDWAGKLLCNYGLTNVLGSVSPVPCAAFRPLETKAELKQSLGLDNHFIIGNVMRNQPRKLFPQMFEMFRDLLDKRKSGPNLYLYCHTSCPDTWELDEYLLKYGLGHKVLFTYQCVNCKYVESSFYKGHAGFCNRCKQNTPTLKFPSVQNPVSSEVLNQIYNLFDIYLQYASLEGYGIPLAEASAVGLPSLAVDYSAMQTFIDEAGTIPIKVQEFYIEPHSSRRFAIPDKVDCVDKLNKLIDDKSQQSRLSKLTRMLYGTRDFNVAIDKWIDAIHQVKSKLSWDSPSKQFKQHNSYPKNLTNEMFAKWLILEVLQEPKLIGSWMESRLVTELNNGIGTMGHDNEYFFPAMVQNNMMQPINQELMFNHFNGLLNKKIMWEQRRSESLSRNQS